MQGAVLRFLLLLAILQPPTAVAGGDATPSVDAWDALWRPLRLPTIAAGSPCPRTEGRRIVPDAGFASGAGPVYPVLGPDAAVNLNHAPDAGEWFSIRVLWLGAPTAQGPFLIRGRQVDGPGELRFGNAIDPADELGPSITTAGASGWRRWPSVVLVQGAGCYAYQIDALGRSEVVVFQTVCGRPDELAPLPSGSAGAVALPRGLVAISAVPIAPNRVRVALSGEGRLVMRLDVEPTRDARLDLSGPDVLDLAASTGAQVLWRPDPSGQWPQEAAWDDGHYRYRLEVLDIEPGGWSETDLLMLVEALTRTASEGTPSPCCSPASGGAAGSGREETPWY